MSRDKKNILVFPSGVSGIWQEGNATNYPAAWPPGADSGAERSGARHAWHQLSATATRRSSPRMATLAGAASNPGYGTPPPPSRRSFLAPRASVSARGTPPRLPPPTLLFPPVLGPRRLLAFLRFRVGCILDGWITGKFLGCCWLQVVAALPIRWLAGSFVLFWWIGTELDRRGRFRGVLDRAPPCPVFIAGGAGREFELPPARVLLCPRSHWATALSAMWCLLHVNWHG
jgi:hypothetical protein